MVCEFRTVQELVDYVEREAWERARKILRENEPPKLKLNYGTGGDLNTQLSQKIAFLRT